jgi:chromate transport protein ChrA
VFASVIATRASLPGKPLAFELFSNMFLAGTIIFGGGPVVIPLLRDYVVEPGWVSSRDFLIGLAVIQALPGPNFNFAVYLGALALKNTGLPLPIGGIVGFVGIFVPGLVLAFGVQSLWERLRTKSTVASALRGVNAIAIGMVFTAVYRLWEIGYVTPGSGRGKSLADEPWWVVVAVVAFSATAWFKIPAPVSIISGGVLGLCWYGIVGRHQF